MSELSDIVLEKEKEGKVVLATYDGFKEIGIDEIINQPAEGILYDLNRDPTVVMTFMKDDIKWVNDYACGMVIRKLKSLLEKEDK